MQCLDRKGCKNGLCKMCISFLYFFSILPTFIYKCITLSSYWWLCFLDNGQHYLIQRGFWAALAVLLADRGRWPFPSAENWWETSGMLGPALGFPAQWRFGATGERLCYAGFPAYWQIKILGSFHLACYLNAHYSEKAAVWISPLKAG